MDLNTIKAAISNNPESVFGFLRDEDVGTRVAAFDAFRQMAISKSANIGGFLADFVEVMRVEVIPNLADESEPEKRAALAKIAYDIGTLANRLNNPATLLPLLQPLVKLLNHPYPKVRSALISGIGWLLRANPGEITEELINRLLRGFFEDDAEVRAATVFAWGNIAQTNPDEAGEAVGPIYRLLGDEFDIVRAEAAGFFHSFAKHRAADCALALPELRQLRDSDESSTVRERASAAVQAILAVSS